jgi:hypothetical protein
VIHDAVHSDHHRDDEHKSVKRSDSQKSLGTPVLDSPKSANGHGNGTANGKVNDTANSNVHSGANGHANGTANGHAHTHVNGKTNVKGGEKTIVIEPNFTPVKTFTL